MSEVTNKDLIPHLDQVIDLLSDEKRWTKYEPAKDQYGNAVSFNNKTAVCWCITAAMRKVCSEGEIWFELRDELLSDLNLPTLVGFNDAKATTHTHIMQALKLTRKRLAS